MEMLDLNVNDVIYDSDALIKGVVLQIDKVTGRFTVLWANGILGIGFSEDPSISIVKDIDIKQEMQQLLDKLA